MAQRSEETWLTVVTELTTDCGRVRVEAGDQLRGYGSNQVREHGHLGQVVVVGMGRSVRILDTF